MKFSLSRNSVFVHQIALFVGANTRHLRL